MTPHTARTLAPVYAHHPSKSSTDEELERRLRPKIEAHHQFNMVEALLTTTMTPGMATTNATSVITGTSNPKA